MSETSNAARIRIDDALVPSLVGHVDPRRVDWRLGGAVFPHLFAVSEPDRFLDHPGGRDLSIASVGGATDRREAKAGFDHPIHRRHFVAGYSDVGADELLRRFRRRFRHRSAGKHTTHTAAVRECKKLAHCR